LDSDRATARFLDVTRPRDTWHCPASPLPARASSRFHWANLGRQGAGPLLGISGRRSRDVCCNSRCSANWKPTGWPRKFATWDNRTASNRPHVWGTTQSPSGRKLLGGNGNRPAERKTTRSTTTLQDGIATRIMSERQSDFGTTRRRAMAQVDIRSAVIPAHWLGWGNTGGQ